MEAIGWVTEPPMLLETPSAPATLSPKERQSERMMIFPKLKIIFPTMIGKEIAVIRPKVFGLKSMSLGAKWKM